MPEPDRHLEVARALTGVKEAAHGVGQKLASRPDRREVWRISLVSACVAALVAAGVAVVVAVPISIAGARDLAETQARTAAVEEQQAASRRRADAALAAAERANDELEKRGQPQVEVPRPGGSVTVQDTIVAAAVAGTLAALPERVKAPTADDLGRAVAAYMATEGPTGVSVADVADQVAAYYEAHPPPPGPEGEPGANGQDGQDGANGRDGSNGQDGVDGADAPPITGDQVRQAVSEVLAENPNILCASTGGTWVRLDNVVVDQDPEDPLNETTTRTLWACAEEEAP